MSWVKKRAQTTTTSTEPPPQVPMYNPNQHSNPENQWQQQPHDVWYNRPQNLPPKPQQQWQQPYQQPYHQQYGQQPEYYQNNTPYGNLQYNQQYNAQNNAYGAQAQTEGDGWSTNWSWGDEDNSNVPAQQGTNVEDSFAKDATWNWQPEETNSSSKPVAKVVKPEEVEWLKTNPSIERLTGKRNKLETPQWSVESQLSQESSDDVLQTSESDKSRMLSRSSTISHSPISGQELTPANHLDNLQATESTETQHFENKEILCQVPPADLNPPSNVQPPPASDESKGNPYKRGTALSHKTRPAQETRPMGIFHPNFPGQVNLETLPDNSEQPDPIPSQPARKASSSSSQPWPENNEAPINDRDQYLETAQLSDVQSNSFVTVPETTDDTLPPPGLRRMIPGRMEQQENNPGLGEGPPPRFSRMVPGQTEGNPPEGLHRMIPGESSSPENDRRPIDDEYNNDMGAQRSATIGADTPPVVNRSETIGADTSPGQTRGKKNKMQGSRRDSIEGQIQDGDVGGLVTSIRNLTVGEQAEEGSITETNPRRHSRQESSDSERERAKSPPADRRRYRDKEEPRDRNRSRYSPDDYREKKYDSRRYKEKRYEEDTDYYSDKERERRHREEREYDRKYNSLRKEKEKDRRKRDDRRDYGRDPRKNDYYYGKYEDDFENESKSRASSRSDSMHDSYRDRDRGHERDRRDRRHREKDRHRRHRDPFNPYAQVFGYDMYNQYYQQYQYYENLRKTNPQAYAQWYRKYYQEHAGEVPYGGEDRASVHSGRSSANDELAKDSFVRTLDQTDQSINFGDTNLTVQRLTPAKFSTAHVKASISSGKLIRVLPHYPLDGQAPSVELCNLEAFLHHDEDYVELKRFPGPLLKGTTHKKTIIEYCEGKIRNAVYNVELNDRDSYVLMWELLILLIRQNGMVVGADIAELLLKNRPQDVPQRPPSAVSSISSHQAEGQTEPSTTDFSSLKEEEITHTFREHLLYGSVKEALEWAMKQGLWGHALFLASKLDKRTYANVLMRFANGLAMNDPLQTLYQLLSGRTPAAVTCVADEKWGDWRPHLAMILSNSTQRPELNCKAITVLGDTLMSRGSLFAAQFCYLMAEVSFSGYGSAEAKLVLLGADHNETFTRFATNEAIHMTEIYEYARSLNDEDFALASFQRYKYLLSTRLADVGLLEKALSYLEKISNFIVKNPRAIDRKLINEVFILADRLKYYDPVGDGEEEVDLDSSRPDNSWLKDLRRIENDFNMGIITHDSNPGLTSHIPGESTYEQNQDMWQPQYDQYQPPQWNTDQQVESTHTEQPKQPEDYHSGQYQEQEYWSERQQWNTDQSTMSYHQEPAEQSYFGTVAHSEEIPQQPQISLPNQLRDGKSREEESLREQKTTEDSVKPKSAENPQNKTSGNGWFGGIFNKLSLKPKNQMKLPDDKNPTILWDPEKKRWINTVEDHGEGGSDFKPPPKMAEIVPKVQPTRSFSALQPQGIQTREQVQENGSIPTNSNPNMFKLQRNRNLKKSYIDVFNPNAKPATQPTPVPLGGGQGAPAQMNFFIPQPVTDPNAPTDFLTPAPRLQYDENQMSRWSSASSLSREVQSYTLHKPNTHR